MAAEAGFDELLRQQALQPQEQDDHARHVRNRSPYRSPKPAGGMTGGWLTGQGFTVGWQSRGGAG